MFCLKKNSCCYISLQLRQAEHLQNNRDVYKRQIKYFDEAVKGLEAQLKDLEKAQKFIFMEYHAIEEAEAWHKIQDVLEERVKAGVEVREMCIRDRSYVGLPPSRIPILHPSTVVL